MTAQKDHGPRRSAVEQANALAALRNLAEDDADTQALIAEAGGIPPLVARLEHGDDAQKAFAAGVLWHLSASAAYQVAIAEAGGIPPLVALARDGDDAQRENATGTLMKLAETRANQALIAKAGGVAVLLACIQDEPDEGASSDGELLSLQEVSTEDSDAARGSEGDVGAKLTAGADVEDVRQLLSTLEDADADADCRTRVAALLLDYSKSEASARMIVSEGGVARLLRRLRFGVDDERALVAHTLGALSCFPEAMIPDSGAAALMVEMLRGGSDAEKLGAASAIKRLAQVDEKNRAAIEAAGAVPVLVTLLRSTTSAQVSAAVSALRSLATKKENQAAISVAGAVAPLVDLVRDGTITQKEDAACVLSQLAFWAVSRAAILSFGGVPALVRLLRCENDDLELQGLNALRILAAENAGSIAIARGEGIQLLVSIVRDGKEQQKIQAARLLWSLSAVSVCRTAIVDWGGIPALEAMASNGSEERRACATTTLRRLDASNSKTMTIETASGQRTIKDEAHNTAGRGIPALVALLGTDSGTNREEAAGALWQLAAEDSGSRQAIVDAGGIPALLALVQEGNSKEKTSAAGALENLASLRAHAAAIVKAGGVPVFVALLNSELDEHRTIAVRALQAMLLAQASLVLIKSNELEPLAGLLQFGSDRLKDAAVCVVRLLSGQLKNQASIGAAGILPPLVALARDGTKEQKIEALRALRFLVICADNRSLIADAGGLWVLRSVLVNGTVYQGFDRDAASMTLWTAVTSLRSRATEEKIGVIPAMIAVARFGMKATSASSLKVLRKMVKNPSTKNIVAAAGGMPLLENPVAATSDKSIPAMSSLVSTPAETFKHPATTEAPRAPDEVKPVGGTVDDVSEDHPPKLVAVLDSTVGDPAAKRMRVE